ncbi:hypothetical protein CABS03_12579 [Colletotrichum abscissum]|uniref:Uncharacterized protein n=1 Tax=Colletotrichum abscissum TaxID=1671311 RepID=A0A9P9XNI4_9PEZI|nr:hypothetical protein CABS02_02600 [Colletotrichum abscissum]
MSLSACTGHNNSDDVRPRVHSRRAVLAFHHRVGRIYSGLPETRIALSPVDKLSSRSLGQSLMGDGRRRGLAANGELCPGVKQTLNPPYLSQLAFGTHKHSLSLPTFTAFSMGLVREVTPGQTQQGRTASPARRSPSTTTTLQLPISWLSGNKSSFWSQFSSLLTIVPLASTRGPVTGTTPFNLSAVASLPRPSHEESLKCV